MKQKNLASQTLSGTSKSIYENNNYHVVVGLPPKTKDFPEPIESYLVVNKRYGVVEYWHSVLFYVKQHADFLSDLLDGKQQDPIIGVNDPSPPKSSGIFN